MKCPKCQSENPRTRKFCRKCGKKLILVCPKCLFENLPDDMYCGGCGRKIRERLEERGSAQTTSGHRPKREGKNINVPKRDLVSTIQVLLQARRLRISAILSEAQNLLAEMANFQVRISQAGHDSYGAWREGTHDDLLLAVALACWAAENKLLPQGMHWPRVSTGRKPIYT